MAQTFIKISVLKVVVLVGVKIIKVDLQLTENSLVLLEPKAVKFQSVDQLKNRSMYGKNIEKRIRIKFKTCQRSW